MTIRIAMGALLLGLLLTGSFGCECDEDGRCCGPDTDPPAAPRGLYSITGDERVTLIWYANTEDDLDGYNVWWSHSYDGTYEQVATVYATHVDEESYVDRNLDNGYTSYYAVTAFDRSGNESELSLDEVWDTPRPEGDAELKHAFDYPAQSGFDLSADRVVSWNSPSADLYFWEIAYENANEEIIVAPALIAEDVTGTGRRAWIQDMGWTADFNEISFAPDDMGWSETGAVEAILGHTYVLLTLGGRQVYYAKIRVTYVAADRVEFQWAFQEAPNNIQLSVPSMP